MRTKRGGKEDNKMKNREKRGRKTRRVRMERLKTGGEGRGEENRWGERTRQRTAIIQVRERRRQGRGEEEAIEEGRGSCGSMESDERIKGRKERLRRR